jgi:hypothetical protein
MNQAANQTFSFTTARHNLLSLGLALAITAGVLTGVTGLAAADQAALYAAHSAATVQTAQLAVSAERAVL